MADTIVIQPLTAPAFAPFGDVLDASGEPSQVINQGLCGRYHDLADLDFQGPGAKAGISLFRSEKRSLPYTLEMVERHPLGSQAFLPMTLEPFLVIVCPDEGGHPGAPRAFRTNPGQGINFHRNVWHGVLTPLCDPGLFTVVDRIGEGNNLEEFWFETPYQIVET
ncbi:ureidoglycolate lyase [Roseibium hamelinense]|uniref:Ureidoglycolate lyase n=1 Tax=Roseibium hamelinense TaxID=150831 RepID=A0A562THZ5_9HYPH|nr:ureidoglycolate lyase [Roseibium hamelinense]MTI45618.1 ureidoglycolate lyase [Roseibium hamelinense]TWI93202.1 ureidoglycolate lyase [Roseibium hamelinense]